MTRQQEVPGYTGHVRGLVHKDFMPKSFAKVTAELYSHPHPMTSFTDTKTRFTTTQKAAYTPMNYRRWGKYNCLMFQLTKAHLSHKETTTSIQNLSMIAKWRQSKFYFLFFRTAIANKTIQFKADIKTIFSDLRHKSVDFNSMTVKPKLIESKVGTDNKFFSMTDGFKKVFTNDARDQNMVIPVVGYGGHRRGDRS